MQGQINAHGRLAHRSREAHQLIHRLAVHPQRHQEPGDLPWRRLAVEDRLHGRLGFIGREIGARGEPFQMR